MPELPEVETVRRFLQEVLLKPKPKKIKQECRFWVVGNEIVTYSQYKSGRTIWYSESAVSGEMIAKAIQIIETVKRFGLPLETYCLDLCDTYSDYGLNRIKIVEINNLNSSGLYDCNVQKLIDALERYYH